MNRNILRWFFLAVQFVMLAVSIPKVAMLFHAYDTQTMGPLIGDVDIRSWLVGFAIDLTATVTTWAALQKFEESRNHLALLAPGLIIAVCSGLSVVANYEDAATLHPAQYANVSLFDHPALLINPLLISAPPLIVLLLILIVPSVLAQTRLKTPEEIEAETAHELAMIAAKAKIRGARLSGLVETASALTGRTEARTGEPAVSAPTTELSAPTTSSARVSKAMWDAMPLKERVLKSGLISANEAAEVLGISAQHARKLIKEVRTDESDVRVPGRSGVAYQSLIDALYAKHSKDSFAQAQRLERALGLKKTRQLHVVAEAGDHPTVPLVDDADEETVG
jgi:hypothetical protein